MIWIKHPRDHHVYLFCPVSYDRTNCQTNCPYALCVVVLRNFPLVTSTNRAETPAHAHTTWLWLAGSHVTLPHGQCLAQRVPWALLVRFTRITSRHDKDVLSASFLLDISILLHAPISHANTEQPKITGTFNTTRTSHKVYFSGALITI